jgi:hypothetical protein
MIGRNFRVSGTLDNTDVVMNQTFWLGTFPALEQPQLDYIAQRLDDLLWAELLSGHHPSARQPTVPPRAPARRRC